MQLFPYSSPSIIGLDIGDQSLKVVALRARTTWKGTRQIDLLMPAEFPVPTGTIVHGELRDASLFTALLRTVHTYLKAQGMKTTEVILGVAESQSYLLTQPASTSHDDITALMAREIPFTVEELYYDSTLTASYRILGAAPRRYVDALIAATEDAGFTVAGLDLEGLATVRAVAYAHPEETAGLWGLIDFGATRTQWMLIDHDVIQSTLRLPMAGTSLTQSIATTLHLSEEQAERTKHECGIDPERCKGSLEALLVPHFETLVKRVREITQPMSTIALVGGGAAMPGVAAFLESALHVNAILPSLFDTFRHTTHEKLPENSLGFATAIGLGLRYIAQ